MSTVSIIAAVTKNLAIGKNNQLLCHIPGDLKRFKELTTGHVVIMGRHTFESLPNGPLPNRKNIVITTTPELIVDGAVAADSVQDAIDLASGNKEVFIIGGGKVYKQAVKCANKLYITWIHADIEGDTFFPEIDFKEWTEISREDFPVSDTCPYAFSYVNYERK